jgi:hypothetical protein
MEKTSVVTLSKFSVYAQFVKDPKCVPADLNNHDVN